MAGLPSLLSRIPDVHQAPYADDITVWPTKGSAGQIQDSVQKTAEIAQRYVTKGSLTCAAEKSELLVIRSRHRSKKGEPEIDLHLEGTPLPRAD